MALLDKFRLESFKALRPNRFSCKVIFPVLVGNPIDLSEKCEIAVRTSELPSRSVGTIELPKRGNPHVIPGNRSTPDQITLTFLNIDGSGLRKAFERWVEALASPIAGTIGNDMMLTGDIIIEQLNGINAVVDTYQLLYAFPVSVGNIALSEDDQDSVESFDVTFAYSIPVTDLLG